MTEELPEITVKVIRPQLGIPYPKPGDTLVIRGEKYRVVAEKPNPHAELRVATGNAKESFIQMLEESKWFMALVRWMNRVGKRLGL